jgi:hypothetical protein
MKHRFTRLYTLLLVGCLAGFAISLTPAQASIRMPAHPMSSFAFVTVHTVTTSNLIGNYSIFYELGANIPNHVLQVMPVWDPGGNCGCIDDPDPVAVIYTGAYWMMFHEDNTPLTLGATYNVLDAADSTSFFQTATISNLVGNWMLLDNPAINGNPNAVIVVTADYTANGICGCVMNKHQVGVAYNGSQWGIFNEDTTSIPVGAQFNVIAFASANSLAWTTRPSRIGSSTFFLNDLRLNWQPNLLLFATPNWNPGNVCGCNFDSHSLGVYYATALGEWSIYNEDYASILQGTAFNLVALPPGY